MLCQFSVKNFRCFRDEITLDMQATSITEKEESLIVGDDREKYLSLAVIYGANGGGKSSVLSALYSLHLKIMRPICAVKCDNRNCNDRSFCMERSVNIPIEPFAFSKDSSRMPTEYELFFRTNTKEYQYQIEIQNNKIIYEALFQKKILGSRYSPVFTRKGSNICLKGTLKSYDVSELSKNLPLLSYLIITHSRNAVLKDVCSWFEFGIDFRNYSLPREEARIALALDNKDLILQMMKEMDIGIDDYRVEESDKEVEIYTLHKINGKNTELTLEDESSGTIKIFGLLPHIADSVIRGTTLVIDELDSKLHPFLLKYIIELYSNPSKNRNGAQLIFTSHDLSTMSSDCFRRDEVWYVAKAEDGASKLYSLVEFARKDASYNKQYLEGKYGACPYLQRLIDWSGVE